jgi:hypothetical protein
MLFSSSSSIKVTLLLALFSCSYSSIAHAVQLPRNVKSGNVTRHSNATHTSKHIQSRKPLSDIRMNIKASPGFFAEQLKGLNLDEKSTLINEFLNTDLRQEDEFGECYYCPYECSYKKVLLLIMEMKDYPESQQVLLSYFLTRFGIKISDVTQDNLIRILFEGSDLFSEAALTISHSSDLDDSQIFYVIEELSDIYESLPKYYNVPEQWRDIFGRLESIGNITSEARIESLFSSEWNRRVLADFIVKALLSKSLNTHLNWGRNEPEFLVPLLNTTDPFANEFIFEIYSALVPHLNSEREAVFYLPRLMRIAQRDHITLRDALNVWLLQSSVNINSKVSFAEKYNHRLKVPINIETKLQVEIKVNGVSSTFE